MNELEAYIKNTWRYHRTILFVVVGLAIVGFYLLAKWGHFQEPAPLTHTDTHVNASGSGVFGVVTSGVSPAGQTTFFDTPDTGASNGLIPFQTMEQQYASDSGLGPGWYRDGGYNG
jgi:hypothetical protein